jgi:dienelactone hydrolase
MRTHIKIQQTLKTLVVCFFIFMPVFSLALDASDLQTIASLVTNGKVLWFKEGNQKTLAIYLAASNDSPVGMVLLPDIGGNANEPQVIGPLRQSLSSKQMATLSLTFLNDKNDKQAVAFVDQALAALKKEKVKRIFLLAYGHSFKTALEVANTNKDIRGLVLLSAYPMNAKLEKSLGKLITDIKVPVLDIVATHDYGNAETAATARARAFANAGDDYRQISITGADHEYSHLLPVVTGAIRVWVKKLESGDKPAKEKRRSP